MSFADSGTILNIIFIVLLKKVDGSMYIKTRKVKKQAKTDFSIFMCIMMVQGLSQKKR